MRNIIRALALIVLLGVFFAQAVAASPRNSVTFDEQYHITLGYTYLKTGDLRLHINQSPPLFEIITSLPLRLRSDIALPLDHPAYALWGDPYLFSDEFLWRANADAPGIVHTGRVVTAAFGALLGLLLFVWGRQWFGEAAGWLAAFLLAFDPNFIANAIPTLDLGLAFFVVLAVWRLWHYLRRPTRLSVVLAGLALGAALSTKFISVVLLPAFALILLIYPQNDEGRRTNGGIRPSSAVARLIRRALAFAAMLAIAWAVIWIVYGFQFGPIHGVGLPVPAPMYFESFNGMLLKSGEGRMNFLSGETSLSGWPHYFAVALLLKTPVPVLLITLVALLRWPWKRRWRESSILIVPAVVLFAAASIGNLQLGYRYILPVLPFVFLVAARNVTFEWPRRVKWSSTGLLAGWLAVGTLSIFPHYLSYFNELGGGPANGDHYLVDSNLDWGQDLPALREWLDAHPPADVRLGFFGPAYPERYGVHTIGIPSYPLNAYGPEVEGFTSYSLEPGRYAISATLLRIGLVFHQFNIYAAFQSMTPIDRAGYSILIYDVRYPPDAEIDRAVIAGPTASDVPPDALGRRPDHLLRARWCAWPECFVFTPHPARYIVRDFIPFAPDLAAQARRLAKTLQPSPGSDYSVYELDATSIIEGKLSALSSAPIRTPDSVALTFPITFDNGLSLVGYEVSDLRGASRDLEGLVEVNTYWRVTDRITPPVTIFVHLLDPQGAIRGQHDGFGAAVTTLEPGDVVIQQHRLTVAADAAPGVYQLQIGLYNPVTLDRFTARPPDAPPIERVLLSTIEVETP